MKFAPALLSVAIVATTTGCATVTRGTTEDVVINYSPADAQVTTSLNHTCSAIPCVVKVPRKDSFIVTASKPGLQTKTVHVGTKLSRKGAAGMAGNVLIGGVVGIGVDAATGAAKDHHPNPVNIQLLPNGASPEQNLSPSSPTAPPRKRTVPTS